MGSLWEFIPLEDASERMNTLPLSGNGFHGKDLPLEPWEKETFKSIGIMKRQYQLAGSTIFVSILDGTNDHHAVHDPQLCFTGDGWNILERENVAVANGSAVIIKMRKGLFYREAVLWFSNGKSRHASIFKFYLQTALRRLTFGWSGGEPIRIIIQPASSSKTNWAEILSSPLWAHI